MSAILFPPQYEKKTTKNKTYCSSWWLGPCPGQVPAYSLTSSLFKHYCWISYCSLSSCMKLVPVAGRAGRQYRPLLHNRPHPHPHPCLSKGCRPHGTYSHALWVQQHPPPWACIETQFWHYHKALSQWQHRFQMKAAFLLAKSQWQHRFQMKTAFLLAKSLGQRWIVFTTKTRRHNRVYCTAEWPPLMVPSTQLYTLLIIIKLLQN